MAFDISSGGASVISTGITTAADYFFGKGTRDAAKDAAKAQQHLFDLQAQEQELKNKALAMSLSDQNGLLPFAASLPSSSSIKNTLPGAKPEGLAAPTSETQSKSAAGFSISTVLLGLAVVAGVFFMRGKA